MTKKQRTYVRRMPKIYGNLQPRRRSFAGVGRFLRNVIWLFAVAAAVYAVGWSPLFRIHHVAVEGMHLGSQAQIQAMAPAGKNIFLVSTSRLANQIEQDPIVQSVAITRGLPDTLRIVVQEKKPALIWQSGSTSYLVDDQGVAFMTSNTNDPTLARVIDTKGLPVKLGQQIVSLTFLQFVDALPGQLAKEAPQVQPDHYELSDTTYDLTLVTKSGMHVLFNTLGDVGVPARNLKRLMSQETIAPNAQIDLRINNWAYVTP